MALFMKNIIQQFHQPVISISLLLMLFFCNAGKAQNVREIIREADVQMQQGKIGLAINNYLKADSLTSGNDLLTFKIGKAYLQDHFKHRALPYLLEAYKNIPDSDPAMIFYVAEAYQYSYKFDEAVKHFKLYLQQHPGKEKEVQKKLEECRISEGLYNNPKDVKIVNLGPTVNSPENDFTPLITPDEKMMVFTSRREGSTGGKKNPDGEYFEDIYLTYRLSDTLWTRPGNISKNINSQYHDAAAALSPDGKKMFVYFDAGGGDLYMSQFDGVDWTKPKTLGNNINTEHWETSVTITADGKKIYFTSNRPGGYGKLDIYLSQLQLDGSWGPAENLGPAINTPGEEDSPFVHPDGQTLYFSSNGLPGLGGFDIFKSELINGKWAPAENFGYPVNTNDDDAHFVMTGNRKKAYFASVKENGHGKADIYSLTFPYNTSKPQATKEQTLAKQETSKPEAPEGKRIVLSGNVREHAQNIPLSAVVSLTNNETSEVVAEENTDPETGNFELMVNGIGSFGLNIQSKGFLFFSKNIKITEADQKKEKVDIKVDVKMRPLTPGSIVALRNIFFNTGEYTLRKDSDAELNKIVKFLQNSPKLKVQINGHTDNTGDKSLNRELSRKRAESVKDFLTAAGIENTRLTVKGFGDERPLVSNDDETDGREINRRTEIEIISPE